MRLISLNAWGGALYDRFAAWLPGCGADVLCLQEVTCTAGLSGSTRFDDGERALPQRANLFADVQAALPEHQGLFLASDCGPVFDEHGNRHQQAFGIATFVHERFPIIHCESAFVHGSYTAHEHWSIANRPRIAHALRLIDPQAQRAVSLCQLHGLRDPAGKGDTPERLQQAHRLAALIDRVRDPDDFVIVCGDLNLLPNSVTFEVLAGLGLSDLVGDSDTRTSSYKKPIRHANYMLVSDPGQVAAFSAPATPEVSDHRLLVLDL